MKGDVGRRGAGVRQQHAAVYCVRLDSVLNGYSLFTRGAEFSERDTFVKKNLFILFFLAEISHMTLNIFLFLLNILLRDGTGVGLRRHLTGK